MEKVYILANGKINKSPLIDIKIWGLTILERAILFARNLNTDEIIILFEKINYIFSEGKSKLVLT